MVFKRLVRPILPVEDDLPFVAYGGDYKQFRIQPESDVLNTRALLKPRVVKLATTASISVMVYDGTLSHDVGSFIINEVETFSTNMAVYCSAIALDGARMLKGVGLTLAGSKDTTDGDIVDCVPGMTYAHVGDLDSETKSTFVRSWPSCLSYASVYLVKAIDSGRGDEERLSACGKWLKALVPLMFCGFHDAADSLSGDKQDPSPSPPWADSLPPDEILTCCLYSMRAWLDSSLGVMEDGAKEEIATVISTISEVILFPSMGIRTSSSDTDDAKKEKPPLISNITIVECCKFLEAVAQSSIEGIEPTLLVALLTPFDAMQKGELDVSKGHALIVLPYLLKAVSRWIQNKHAKESLVNAMLQLSIELLSKQQEVPKDLHQAGESILTDCLNNDAISAAKQRAIGLEMGSRGKWDAWAIICARSEAALSSSIEKAKEAVGDVRDSARHLATLSALRLVVQGASSTTVGIVVKGAGAQVMSLLKGYGTLSLPTSDMKQHRTVVCADAMKILLVTYQQLSSSEESLLVAFVSTLFDVWVEVIRFNGLPNQASPQAGADPTLGRIMAQAIVHVARTTPTAFKTSMTTLSDHSRAVLEFAVRADMSGYASSATQTTTKKKLSLKGYTK